MGSRAGHHEQMLMSPQIGHMLARRVRLPNCATDQNYFIAQRTGNTWANTVLTTNTSVGDPHVFGPPGSGSISQSYGPGSFPFLIDVLNGLK